MSTNSKKLKKSTESSAKLKVHPIEPNSFSYKLLQEPRKIYSSPIEWPFEMLNHIDCDVLPNANNEESTNDTNPKSILDSTIPWTDFELEIHGALFELSIQKIGHDTISRRLFKLLIPKNQSALKTSYFSISLYFGSKPVARISPYLFRELKTTRAPIFAFIDRTWLFDLRKAAFKNKSRWSRYEIACSMRKLDFDPYIAGLLISMAQWSFSTISDDETKVHVFCTSRNNKSFTQYSATISRQYIQKWEKPYKLSSSRLIITQKELFFDQPNAIIQAISEIEKPYIDPSETLVSPQKRKVRSDIADDLPAFKRVHH